MRARAPDIRWLARLRWMLIVFEGLVVVSWTSVRAVPWIWLAAAMGAQLVSNAALVASGVGSTRTRPGQADGARELAWRDGVVFGLSIDVVALSTILACGGGAGSPLCVVLLVQVTLAAVALRGARTWGVVALAIACYGALFAFTDEGHGDLGAHLREMFVAFTITAVAIAFAVGRLAIELERARERADASSRVMGMTTLAAGAAHELATPLATIKTVVGELERELAGRDDLATVRDDLALVRAEVGRSRAILDQLSVAAGELRGEAPVSVAISSLAGALEGLPRAARARVRVRLPDAAARIPARALGQALAALVKNAIDASGETESVELDGEIVGGTLRLTVRDHGAGMSADTLARVGEPFFTTKDPGRGMGLGLFLVRALAAHLRGDVRIDSIEGRGTTVTLEVPTTTEGAG